MTEFEYKTLSIDSKETEHSKEDKMMKKVNQACEKLNRRLGISVELPNPKKKALKTAAACNLVVGAGLVAAGIFFPSKSCALLGGISVISSVVLRKESKHKNHESEGVREHKNPA